MPLLKFQPSYFDQRRSKQGGREIFPTCPAPRLIQPPVNFVRVQFPRGKSAGCGVYHPPLVSPRMFMCRPTAVPPLCAFVDCYIVKFVLFTLTKSNVYEELPTAKSFCVVPYFLRHLFHNHHNIICYN